MTAPVVSWTPSEAWLLAEMAQRPISDAQRAVFTAQLATQRRVLIRALDDGDEVTPIHDVAFHRYTRQSTRGPSVVGSALTWAAPTEAEAAPWWEIDLGTGMFVAAIHVHLEAVPAGARIEVASFSFATPAGEPPPESTVHVHDVTGAGTLRVDVSHQRIARYVRVTLVAPAGATAVLAVAACEILAADLFPPTLQATMRRAFALHHDRPLFLESAAGASGYRPSMTYGEAWSRAMALARGLAARLEGDEAARTDGRIFLAIVTRNRPEWVLADQAALARGYVAAPMAPDDGDERAGTILGMVRPGCVVCEAADADRLAALAPGARLMVICDATAEEARAWPATPARVRIEDLIALGAARDGPPPEPRRDDDVYAVLFTSGSTGTPRGAMRSYATFKAMLTTYGAGQPARHLSFQPLSHLSERMFLPGLLVHGAAIAFSRGGVHLLDELRTFEPTVLGSVPRLFDVLFAAYQRRLRAAIAGQPDTPRAVHEQRALAESRQAFGRRLQSLSVGSAPVSPEVLAFLRRCFADIWVTEGYGSTEVGTIAVDGRIQAHVDVKLVPLAGDEQTAVTGGAGARGEIWVRTPHVIIGYLGDPAATAAAIDRDGYFATGDLGERAADGSVRVVGRLRNAVKLAQGEFVAAERVESALATADGVDRLYVQAAAGAPGISALVFTRTDGPDDGRNGALTQAAVLAALRAHGRRAGLSAWELPRGVLLIAEAPSTENGLLTASGKLARGAIDARFGARLAALAAGEPPSESASDSAALGDGSDLATRIARVVARVVGRATGPHEPLAAAGVDSLAAAEILAALGDELGREVPLALWFEAATIDDLATRLESFADPGAAAALRAVAAEDLAHGATITGAGAAPRLPLATVLLTGATGFLGAHLVEALVARSPMRVVCLVRGTSDRAAAERLAGALGRHGIAAPPTDRVRTIAGDLAAPRLGLDDDAHRRLGAEIDAVVHAGAVVSWLAPYAGLRDVNVGGTRALLELAAAGGRARPFHHVSTISTAPADGDESSTLDAATAMASSPYALSKWIAEVHVRRAAAAGLPVAVYRPALIAGHSQRGCGNPDDFLHRYLAGARALGLYLDLDDAVLDMTPVDFVAAAIVALLVATPLGGGTHHLANVEQSMSYARLGRAMAAAGVAVAPADYQRFRAALVAARSSRLAALAAFFPATGFALGSGPWPCARTVSTLAALGVSRPPVDDALIARYLRASDEIGPG